MSDFRAAVRQGPMSGFQMAVVAVCIAVNAIDGFDVLAAAFVAPTLSKLWSIDPRLLGLFLGAGPVGMALGALVLGPLADVFGRRNLVIFCVSLMGLGMFLSAGAQDLYQLIALRIVTGLGIGGALASANTVVAEYSSDRRRGLAVSLMAGGYPIGATLGGLAAIWLLQNYDWRAVFVLGGALSLILIPFVLLYLPESLEYLVARRSPGALERANVILRRIGQPEVDALPPPDVIGEGEAGGGSVFGPELRRGLVLICLAYFMVMLTLYFVLQWTPKLLVNAGLSAVGGVSGGTLMNLGGIVGSFGFGVLTSWMAPRRLAPLTMVATFISLALFAFAPVTLEVMLPLGFLCGVVIFGAITSLYAVVPLIFPARVRGAGTGLALGLGRLGAILGPIVAGYLVAAQMPRWQFTLALAVPMLIGALAVARIPLWHERKGPAGQAESA
jgi:benzoate transport